jgi:hypothetical protein
MFLVFLPIVVFFRFFVRLLRGLAQYCKFYKEISGISIEWKLTKSVDEALGNYWNCIPGQNQMRMFL